MLKDLVVLVVMGLVILSGWGIRTGLIRRRRRNYLDNYRFHASICNKVKDKYPQLDAQQIGRVFQGLREYFHICLLAGQRHVAMPSQVVDDAWHEFILFTRAYDKFCHQALGRFLHHTPAEAMKSRLVAQEGIQRAWRLACYQENIDPRHPTRLPLLFALDSDLNIPNGFKYSLDCQVSRRSAADGGYCATHIGCASGCSGNSGADSGSDGSGSSDSSGCSGGGCGGD